MAPKVELRRITTIPAFACPDAETSNRCWRGELPLDRVQERAEEVLAIDALLRGLAS